MQRVSLKAYLSFQNLLVQRLCLETLVCLKGLRGRLVLESSPVLGGQVRGVGLCQGSCLSPGHVHLSHPKQHIRAANMAERKDSL